jgi:acetyltransferase-like isoleucine patch superfamily enzyme
MIQTLKYLWAKSVKKVRLSAVVDSEIERTAKVESGSHVVNSSLGRHSFCGYDCEIYNCEIGAFCSIGNGVKIGGAEHPMAWVSMSPVFNKGRDSVTTRFAQHPRLPVKRTVVGNDVWIAAGVSIKQGVTIGDGAVVGMGSVVTKDVEAYSVVGGCPAKSIRMRFDPEVVAELLRLAWWNWSEADLNRFGPYIQDPRLFIEKARSR